MAPSAQRISPARAGRTAQGRRIPISRTRWISIGGAPVLFLGFALGALGGCGHEETTPPAQESSSASGHAGGTVSGAVVINGRSLGEAQLREFEQTYGARPRPGAYWYDARSGLWGTRGQPSAGFLLAGHDLGPLRPNASRGDTRVFLNGRQLPATEVLMFAGIVGSPILPGRYWLDGFGNYGWEGVPLAAGNLYAIVAARMGGGGGIGGGGDNFWSSRFGAGNSNAANTQGYVSVPGVGPVSYGM